MTIEKVTLIAAIISALVAIITVKLSYTNEKRKWILEKRTALYLEVYEGIDKVLHDRRKVFDDDYFNFLIKIKPQIKLLASKKTFGAFERYYNFIRKKKIALKDFRDKNDPTQRVHTEYDEYNDVEYEVNDFDESDLRIYSRKCEEYLEENCASIEVINEYVTGIYGAMRKDLGSNLR